MTELFVETVKAPSYMVSRVLNKHWNIWSSNTSFCQLIEGVQNKVAVPISGVNIGRCV